MSNQRSSGILLSYLNILLNTAITFSYIPILLFYLGKSEYGLYQLMGSLVAYFGIMDFGLSASIIRFYTKYKTLKDKIGMENILAIACYAYGVISILMFLLGIAFYFFIDIIFGYSLSATELQSAKNIYMLLVFNVIITVSTLIFRAVINANEKFLVLKGLDTLQIILQPIAVIAIMQLKPTAIGIVVVQTIFNLLLISIRGYYCFAKLGIVIKFHYLDKKLFNEIKRLALSVFVVALIDQVFWKTNQIILGIIEGTASVAVYSIASIIYMNYMSLSSAISGVYLPRVTEMITGKANKSEISNLFIRIGRIQYLLLALVLSGFLLFGRDFIKFWAGDSFSDAYFITLIIIVPFTIDLIQNIGLSILQAQNKYSFRAKVYLCIGVLNCVLAVPLAYKFGGIGCAVASGATMFIGNGLLMNWYYYRITGLDIKEFWRQIGNITGCVIASVVIGLLLNIILITNSVIILLIKIFAYCIIYQIILWQYGMNRYEKELEIRLFEKIKVYLRK